MLGPTSTCAIEGKERSFIYLFIISDIFGQTFPSFSHHNKVLAFLTLLRSPAMVVILSDYSSDSFAFLQNFFLLFLLVWHSPIYSLQNIVVNQSLWLDSRL